MNIFTRIIPAQGPPQTFEEQVINQTFIKQNKYKKVCSNFHERRFKKLQKK